MRKQEGHSLSAFPEIFTAREGSCHSHWIRFTSIFLAEMAAQSVGMFLDERSSVFHGNYTFSTLKWLQFSRLQASFEGMTGRLSDLSCVSYCWEYDESSSMQLSFSKAIQKCMISPICSLSSFRVFPLLSSFIRFSSLLHSPWRRSRPGEETVHFLSKTSSTERALSPCVADLQKKGRAGGCEWASKAKEEGKQWKNTNSMSLKR